MIGSRPSRPVIKAYTDVLTFGKYKGHTVEWVLVHNPSYIVWLAHAEACDVDGKIYTDAQALHEKSKKFKRWADRNLHHNHNYSSYYDDGDWLGIDPYDWCD